MTRKLRIKKRAARDKIIHLIRKILKETERDTPKKDGSGRRITKRTGNLFKEVKPEITTTSNGNVVIEVKMMNYYQWLDAGTSKMDGWFFSEEIMDSKELEQISEDLLFDLVEGKILDMISDIKK